VRRDDDEMTSASTTVAQRCEPAGSRDSHEVPNSTTWVARCGVVGPSLCGQVSPAGKHSWSSSAARCRCSTSPSGRAGALGADDDDMTMTRAPCIDAALQCTWLARRPQRAHSLRHVHSSVSFSLCTWSVLDPDRRIVAICRPRLYKARDAPTCSSSNKRRDRLTSVSLPPN